MIAPWAVILIILGSVALIIVIAIVSSGSGSSRNSGILRKIFVLDLKNYMTQKTFKVFKVHKDLLAGGDWKRSTQDRNISLVREKGMFKKPEHEISNLDSYQLTDSETGQIILINGISSITQDVSKQLYDTQIKLDQALSRASELETENLQLRRHMGENVQERVDTSADMINKVIPFGAFSKKSSGGSK